MICVDTLYCVSRFQSRPDPSLVVTAFSILAFASHPCVRAFPGSMDTPPGLELDPQALRDYVNRTNVTRRRGTEAKTNQEVLFQEIETFIIKEQNS